MVRDSASGDHREADAHDRIALFSNIYSFLTQRRTNVLAVSVDDIMTAADWILDLRA